MADEKDIPDMQQTHIVPGIIPPTDTKMPFRFLRVLCSFFEQRVATQSPYAADQSRQLDFSDDTRAWVEVLSP